VSFEVTFEGVKW